MMKLTRHAAAVVLLATVGLGVQSTPTVAQGDDIQATIQIDSGGQDTMELNLYLGDDRMRMDMAEEMSLISLGGAEPTMLMVQHPDQSYMEWGPQQLQMMQQMMQQMQGNANQAANALNPGDLEFVETGETAQIGPWNAFEVEMTDANGNQGSLWLTTDSDVGLFEVMIRAADAASLLNSPMGGGGMGLQFLQFQSMAQAQGLPDGRVVRIVSGEASGDSIITLTSLVPGPIADDMFAAPAGYTPMQMPNIPGFPG